MRSYVSRMVLAALLGVYLGEEPAYAGAIVRLFYGGAIGANAFMVPGSSVADLTNNVNFPTRPSASEVLTNVLEGSSNWADNYGSTMEGWLEAPQTGSYTFWIESADDSQLWISTNDVPSDRQLIAWVYGRAGPREWNVYPSQQSAPLPLVRGQVCYLQVLHKAGLGSDNVAVGWQLPDNTLERPLEASHLQPYTNAVIVPQIVGQPASANVVENTDVQFQVTMSPSPTPNTYQWYQNATPIAGATLSAYSTRARLTNNGSHFSCQINGKLTSAQAALSVTNDTTPPLIMSASPRGNPYQVTVEFSKEVDPDSATNTINYFIDNGATVTRATSVAPDAVVLTTSIRPGFVYTLTVNNVLDTAATPNGIAPNSQVNFVLTDGAVQVKFWDQIPGTNTIDLLRHLSVLDTPPSRSLWNTAFETPAGTNGANYLGQIAGYISPIESGDYVFGIAAGGSAILYLSTDEEPTNKTEIAAVLDAATGSYQFTNFVEQLSSSISLVAGQRYYLEAVWKAGAAANGVQVTWQPPGTLEITNGHPAIASPFISAIKTFGPVVITNQPPARIRGAEDQSVTLSIGSDGVDGSPIYAYQWTKNGTNIPGATSFSYMTPPLALSDSGASFALVVSNAFSFAVSTPVQLTIDPDLSPPTLLSAGCLQLPAISVAFSEPLDVASATNLTNYVLTTAAGQVVPLASATLSDQGDVVTLTAPALIPGTNYSLAIANLKDRSQAGNVLTNATTTFVPFALTVININNTQPYAVGQAGSSWSLTAGGADIGGTADRFLFAYQRVTGDFDYQLDVQSISASDPWAKCGLMARASLSPASRFVLNCVTPEQGNDFYSALGRSATASSNFVARTTPAAPYPKAWLRLRRAGNVFDYYWSADGTNWAQYFSYNTTNDPAGPLPSNILLGIATTSRSAVQTTTAVVSDFGPTSSTNAVVQLQIDSIVKQGANAVVTWTGSAVLQSATNVIGPWSDISGAGSPYTTPLSGNRKFFRLHN